MEREGRGERGGIFTAVFFFATLLLSAVTVFFEIWCNGRSELTVAIAGFVFFQIANDLIRRFISKDPLFVNTAVSLLHSSITSASVVFILINQWRIKGANEMFEHEELVNTTWFGSYWALCFSCGYFAYDQFGYASVPVVYRYGTGHPCSSFDSLGLFHFGSFEEYHH